MLESYNWPGNVRELQNVIERAVMMGSTDLVVPEDLPDLPENAPLNYLAHLAATKRALLERAFALADGHHNKASALLGLNPTHVYALKKLDMPHLRRPRTTHVT